MSLSSLIFQPDAGPEGRRRSIYLFEVLALELLRKKYAPDNGPLQLLHGDFGVDAIAPRGVKELPAPTGIIVKYGVHADGMFFALRRTLLRAKKTIRKPVPPVGDQIRSLVVLASVDLPEERAQELTETAGIPVGYLGLQELEAIAAEYPDFYDSVVKRWETLAVRQLIGQPAATPLEWESARDRHIDQLRQARNADKLVLFLGAGVSIPAGIPSWNGILKHLLVAMVARLDSSKRPASAAAQRKIADRLQASQNSSPLLVARYIRAGLGDNFEPALSDALYRPDIKTKERDFTTLDAISRLCVPPRGALGVAAAVSYNFDDLLERRLAKQGVEATPLFSEGTTAKRGTLPVYHVHGFLPHKDSDSEGASDSIVVFSEERYHALYNDPYSWANLTQLSLLLDNCCLFIGLSMTDPNLRRLLEISSRKSTSFTHYALLKRETVDEVVGDGPDHDGIESDTVNLVVDAHHRLLEQSYAELGVKVIWAASYDEIPSILDRIRRER